MGDAEHSDAAKAAYPNGLRDWRESRLIALRTAFDRGAASRQAEADAAYADGFAVGMEGAAATYAITREALAAAIGDEPGSVWAESLAAADRILASAALVDVNEVKAEALEEFGADGAFDRAAEIRAGS